MNAMLFINGKKAIREASEILEKFLLQLDEAGIGTISEIFDAEFPHAPRGCIAQAWGIGEAFRVAVEYRLFETQGDAEKIPAHSPYST